MAAGDEPAKGSFWTTLPGVLSALGGLLAGIAAIVTAVIAVQSHKSSPSTTLPTPTSSSPAVSTSASPPTSVAGPKPLTASDLVGVRLVLGDLPPGWSVQDGLGPEIWPCNQSPLPARAVTSGPAAFDLATSGVVQGAAITRLDGYNSATDAGAALASIRANGERCAVSEFNEPGTPVPTSFRFAPISGPAAGDESVHLELSETDTLNGARQDSLVSFVRWGRTILVAEYAVPGTRTAATDAGQADLINRAVAKLNGLSK